MIANPDNRRVVVTGIGVVSSIGIGWPEFWENLIAGKSGISRVESFDTSQHDCHVGGEVKNFDPAQFMSKRRAVTIGRTSQMAIAASKLALRDAQLNSDGLPEQRIGLCLGTTMGDGQILQKIVEGYVPQDRITAKNSLVLSYPANLVVSNVAREFGLRGRNVLFTTACAAGNYAIGRAFDLIKMGKEDCVLAGGADSLSRTAYTGFERLLDMADKECRPFDKDRQGIVVGEGAAIVVLESLENAQRRKAPVYAEVLGYGMSCNARDMTEPDVEGIAMALRETLENAGISADQINYISAHGTGTVENDKAECQAIKKVFGPRSSRIPVSGIKSMLGHTMGAAAAFGAIACCLAIKNSRIPPTINHGEDDPKCKIDCVPNKGRRQRVKIALNNSLAFGGNNANIIFGVVI
jgi:3-oxoacyl-[acyl-carrier-protein] synthase II